MEVTPQLLEVYKKKEQTSPSLPHVLARPRNTYCQNRTTSKVPASRQGGEGFDDARGVVGANRGDFLRRGDFRRRGRRRNNVWRVVRGAENEQSTGGGRVGKPLLASLCSSYLPSMYNELPGTVLLMKSI